MPIQRLLSTLALLLISLPVAAQDLALIGGRVMDPETGLDAVRNVVIEDALDLMTALSKMSLQPAQRLEGIAPQMKQKRRVQVGADADLTIFDPATVRSRATYSDSMQRSEGIRYVLVGGTPLVRNGEIVEGLAPGQPIYGRHRN